MGRQSKLQELLTNLMLPFNGKVYFQPPDDLTMEYPCIRYTRASIRSQYAGNRSYIRWKQYMLTVIDTDPDSGIVDAVSELPMCKHDRHYIADNLHHDVFIINY